MILYLKVKAGSRFNKLSKDADGNWTLRVKMIAADGKANKEMIRFLSECLHLPKSAIILESGFNRPHKKIRIENLADEEVNNRLNQSSMADKNKN
jgi:uncharacterized protein YggU (UPF0235/DUF167 family)